MRKTKQFVALFSFIVLSLLIGFLGSVLPGVSMSDAYLSISSKPTFSPPSWVFAPVWSILYILMGTAAYLMWKQKGKKNVKKPLTFFFIQLVLNLLWPIIFFGLGQYFWAFIEIMLLLIMIIIMILSFSKVSKTASYLLFPYLLWVGFASMLNLAIALAK